MTSATIGTCDDCGNETATLNVNTPGNPYMLCGKCQYGHMGSDDLGQEWNSSDGEAGLTILNDRIWVLASSGVATVYSKDLPELITALEVALARQQAASKGDKHDG
jgi:hypothetical protein